LFSIEVLLPFYFFSFPGTFWAVELKPAGGKYPGAIANTCIRVPAGQVMWVSKLTAASECGELSTASKIFGEAPELVANTNHRSFASGCIDHLPKPASWLNRYRSGPHRTLK
jgi:hypothetical protein